jgi:hypothetical protein
MRTGLRRGNLPCQARRRIGTSRGTTDFRYHSVSLATPILRANVGQPWRVPSRKGPPRSLSNICRDYAAEVRRFLAPGVVPLRAGLAPLTTTDTPILLVRALGLNRLPLLRRRLRAHQPIIEHPQGGVEARLTPRPVGEVEPLLRHCEKGSAMLWSAVNRASWKQSSAALRSSSERPVIVGFDTAQMDRKQQAQDTVPSCGPAQR